MEGYNEDSGGLEEKERGGGAYGDMEMKMWRCEEMSDGAEWSGLSLKVESSGVESSQFPVVAVERCKRCKKLRMSVCK